MSVQRDTIAPAPLSQAAERAGLVAIAAAIVFAVSLYVGLRFGLLLAIGLGYGVVLEGFRFGFAGPWRRLLTERDVGATLAQLLSIALVAIVAIPLVGGSDGVLIGAHAPVGIAMIGGAFVFGASMQVVMGCGSGTLVNAGSGNPVGLVALPFFALGSFAGAWNLIWWTSLGSAPLVVFGGAGGLAVTLAALAAVAALLLAIGRPGTRAIPRRLVWAACLLAALAILNLIVAGQPWGVVYGLGLWAAKGAAAAGLDLTQSAFWGGGANLARVSDTLLTDATSLTNIGLLAGACIVTVWRNGLGQKLPDLPLRAWIAAIVAGFLLGYSSRLAFGCNVGAYFSGIATGSLHGWAWFAAGLAGSWVGVKLRKPLGLA